MNMTVLPGLADDGSGPVFASPWQAQIFSLVVGLHESGCFSWNEWAEALSREIAEDSSGGADGVMTHEEIDPSDSYYGLWVSTLEQILARKTILDSDEVRERGCPVARSLSQHPSRRSRDAGDDGRAESSTPLDQAPIIALARRRGVKRPQSLGAIRR